MSPDDDTTPAAVHVGAAINLAMSGVLILERPVQNAKLSDLHDALRYLECAARQTRDAMVRLALDHEAMQAQEPVA